MDNDYNGILLIRDAGLSLDEPAVIVRNNDEYNVLCVDEESSLDGNTSGVEDPIVCSGF